MTVPRPDGDQWQDQASPPGQRPRRRAYFVMMGVCLVLFICSWAFVWRFSLVAAVVMSAVALVIPPFAAIVANNGPMNRQRP